MQQQQQRVIEYESALPVYELKRFSLSMCNASVKRLQNVDLSSNDLAERQQ